MAFFVVVVVGLVFVVVVVAFFVVVVVAFFVVVVVAFFVVVVVGLVFVVVVVRRLERVRDRVHFLRDLVHRSARGRHCFKRVFQALFQIEAVRDYQCGVFHPRRVLHGGLVAVRVAADRDDGVDVCEPVARDVRHDVGPDAGGGQDRRGTAALLGSGLLGR